MDDVSDKVRKRSVCLAGNKQQPPRGTATRFTVSLRSGRSHRNLTRLIGFWLVEVHAILSCLVSWPRTGTLEESLSRRFLVLVQHCRVCDDV
jgi:hypothetical protein